MSDEMLCARQPPWDLHRPLKSYSSPNCEHKHNVQLGAMVQNALRCRQPMTVALKALTQFSPTSTIKIHRPQWQSLLCIEYEPSSILRKHRTTNSDVALQQSGKALMFRQLFLSCDAYTRARHGNPSVAARGGDPQRDHRRQRRRRISN